MCKTQEFALAQPWIKKRRILSRVCSSRESFQGGNSFEEKLNCNELSSSPPLKRPQNTET